MFWATVISENPENSEVGPQFQFSIDYASQNAIVHNYFPLKFNFINIKTMKYFIYK